MKAAYDSVRIPKHLVKKAVRLIPQFPNHPALRVSGNVSKALAVKVCLLEGLNAMGRVLGEVAVDPEPSGGSSR